MSEPLLLSQPTCTRRLQFCAGHRVHKHESKCAHLHGHNYVVFLTARTTGEDGLDEIGRVVDFSVLKDRLGWWIDHYWDHGFILSKDDAAMINWFTEAANRLEHGQKLHVMPYNPTAENMARFLLEEVGPAVLEGFDIELCHVRLWETENCYADSSLADHGQCILTLEERIDGEESA